MGSEIGELTEQDLDGENTTPPRPARAAADCHVFTDKKSNSDEVTTRRRSWPDGVI